MAFPRLRCSTSPRTRARSLRSAWATWRWTRTATCGSSVATPRPMRVGSSARWTPPGSASRTRPLVGILAPAEVDADTSQWCISASDGEKPSVGRPADVDVKHCVELGCHEHVRVVQEGEVDAPDDENKFCAPGVGVIDNGPPFRGRSCLAPSRGTTRAVSPRRRPSPTWASLLVVHSTPMDDEQVWARLHEALSARELIEQAKGVLAWDLRGEHGGGRRRAAATCRRGRQPADQDGAGRGRGGRAARRALRPHPRAGARPHGIPGRAVGTGRP